jgi:hypothetical protein
MTKKDQAIAILTEAEAFAGGKLTLDEMEDTLLHKTNWKIATIVEVVMSIDYPENGFSNKGEKE